MVSIWIWEGHPPVSRRQAPWSSGRSGLWTQHGVQPRVPPLALQGGHSLPKMRGAPHLQTELPSFASLDLAGMSPGKWRQFLGTWFHAAAPPAQGPWERWGRIREGPGVNLLCMALPLVTCHVAGSARCSWPPMAPSPVPALIPDLQTTHRGIEQLRPFVLGSRSDPGRGAGRTPLGPAALGER